MESLINNEYFEAAKGDQIAVITFKAKIFDLITSLEDSQMLMEFLRKTEQAKEVKGLLFVNRPGCLGEEAYDGFLQKILNKERLSEELESEAIAEHTMRFRQLNMLKRFVKYLANYQKLFFAGLNCQIVTPFIGAVMVADFRFASRNASFSFAHIRYGLHPSGGLPFFMTHYLGYAKAIDIQLSESISAEEAYSIGLINRILPEENFEANCIRAIKPYLNFSRPTLRLTKQLNAFAFHQLDHYFDFESGLLNL